MKLISEGYNDIILEQNFQYENGLQNYEIAKYFKSKSNTYYELFFNKYCLFTKIIDYKLPKSGILRLFYENTYSNFRVPILYKTISPSFIPDYSILKDIEDYILDKRNILLFNWGINISEALLYLFTENNIINQVKMYIYHLYCILNFQGEQTEFTKYFDKLSNNFEGEQLFTNNNPDENPTTDYENIVKHYKNKNIDFVYFDYRITGFLKNPSLSKLHFACTLITLLTLQKGGVYIFVNIFSSTYLKHILTLLSKYFEKIFVHHDIVKTQRRHVVICVNYKGISSNDINMLEHILKSWNIVETTDKASIGSIVSLFKNTNPKIDKMIDSYIANIIRYYQKIINIYDENMQNIEQLSYEVLKKYYDNHVKITYNRHIAYAKQYNLKLSNDFLEKNPNYINEINSIFVIKNPDIYTYLLNFKTKDISPSKNQKQYSTLAKIKQELTLYKIGIDTRNPKKWDQLTHNLNITQGLIYYLKNKFNAKLTRAFFKMYEILETFRLIDSMDKQVKSLHICEAPGHFINATHYYIKTKYPDKELDWYANSLNPFNQKMKEKYGTLFSDQYGFIKRFPKRWLWGADDTGDITTHVNIEYFKKNFANKIDIMTSDCGLGANTRYEYNSQEEWMGKINYCQILIGLIVTRIGGSSIFKYFMPFSKANSLSLIYLLVQHYESVNIFKPLMTSSTNNEVYIVAQNKIKDLSTDDYNKMLKFLKEFDIDKSLYEKVDKQFLNHTYHISNGIINRQIDNLKVVYYYYENDYDNKIIQNLRMSFAKKWILKYDFKYYKSNLL